MPLSYFRRPLALLGISYVLLLCLLRSRGAFETELPADWSLLAPRPESRLEGRLVSGLIPGRQGWRAFLRPDRALRLGPGGPADIPLRRPCLALVWLARGDLAAARVLPGQRVALSGRLRPPRRPLNPGEFDERSWLALQGAGLVLHARRLELLDPRVPWRWKPMAWAESVRRSMRRSLQRFLPARAAALMEGLLLGAKGPLDPALERALRDAGAVHLLVPSGSNVLFLMGLAFGASGLLRLPRAWGAALGAGLCGFYALMQGGDAPYLRAYLSLLAGLATRGLGRGGEPFQAILLSGLALLLWRPAVLFETGFQMSFLSVLALLLALPRWPVPSRWPAPLRALARLAQMGVAAQLALWPLLASCFGRVSLAGVLSGVPLAPLAALLTAGGLALWPLSALPWLWPAAAAGWLLELGARAFESTAFFFAALPGAAFDAPVPGPWEAAAYYLELLGLLTLPERKTALRFCAAGALVLAAGLCARLARPPVLGAVFMAREGRGAALLSLPDGRRVLVSGGLPPSALLAALRALGARRLDTVLVPRGPGLCAGAVVAGRLGAGALIAAPGAAPCRRLLPPAAVKTPPGPAPRPPEGADLLDLSWRDLRLRVGAGAGEVLGSLSSTGPEPGREFCILLSPRGPRGACAGRLALAPGGAGALRLRSDGRSYQVSFQRDVDPLGRSFP